MVDTCRYVPDTMLSTLHAVPHLTFVKTNKSWVISLLWSLRKREPPKVKYALGQSQRRFQRCSDSRACSSTSYVTSPPWVEAKTQKLAPTGLASPTFKVNQKVFLEALHTPSNTENF